MAPLALAAARDGSDAVHWAAVALLAAAVVAAAWAALRRRSAVREAPRLSFLGHVEELRRRLLGWTAALLAATAFAFSFRLEPWRGVWRPVPGLQENLAAQVFRRMVADLAPDGVRPVATRPLDGFMAEFTIALALGFLLSLPVLLWQAARFLGPALRRAERRLLLSMIVPATVLFTLGVVFGYTVVLPFLFTTLYGYAAALEAELFLHVQDFVVFTAGLLVVFGLAFQTPLAMAALTRVGLVASATWLGKWRHALVAILVLSALVTDPTVVSQILVAVPLTILYFVGVGVSRMVEHRTTQPAR